MPGSKKGRLSGGARKEINEKRSSDAVSGRMTGVVFGRITKMLGANHVMVSIESKHGFKELRARIPNILARRGATPITTRDVVAVEVGVGFDPDDKEMVLKISDLFDIKAVLTSKQVYALQQSGEIPAWMATDASSTVAADNEAIEFDYSGTKEGADEEEEEKPKETKSEFNRRVAFVSATTADDEINIDDI
jgi:translation initiation factor IF-1